MNVYSPLRLRHMGLGPIPVPHVVGYFMWLQGLADIGRIAGRSFRIRLPMPLRALLYRRPSEPQAIELVFDGAMYLVRLSRHRRARRYTLRIQPATREVVLTMPPRGNVNEAKAFAERHGGWIAARLGRLPETVA